MSIRKRNEFLDGGDSDEELDRGYDSESQEQSRGEVAGRSAKRRRTGNDADTDLSDGSDGEADAAPRDTRDPQHFEKEGNTESDPELLVDPSADQTALPTDPTSRTKRAPVPKKVAAAHKSALKSGVVYISRVPPFMKPQTLKHYLEPHAPRGLGRVFLTPEDDAAHAARVRRGGNRKRSFADGWVEFASKRDARDAADTLNGNIIGGKKGGFYHDDIWTVKYLRGFKWNHLTEQIANENAERATRLREEVRKTRQENRAFVLDVERGKMMETREEKRKAKIEREGGDSAAPTIPTGRPDKKFRQKKVRDPAGLEDTQDAARIARVGSMIL